MSDIDFKGEGNDTDTVWVPSLNTTEMHIWRSLAFEIFVSVATVKSLLFLENH